MKKLSPYITDITLRVGLFLALILGGIGVVWGQATIYSENFNSSGGSFPSGWSSSGSSNQWYVYNGNNLSTNPPFSGGYHIVSGNTNNSRTLTYASVSTSGFTNITVLWAARRTNNSSPTFAWSSDGGNNWTNASYTDVSNNSTWAWVNGATRISLPGASNVSSLRFRWVISNSSQGYRIDDFSVQGTPAYLAQFISMNKGSSNWCQGETRTITVTIKNAGNAIWTNSGPDVNIGVKWNADADYNVRTDANNLAPGATQTYLLTVTAPAAGSNNLTFDVVKEADCWFGNNNGSCGPGNTVFTSSALTINANPSPAPASAGISVCTGKAASLTASGAGAGEGYKWYDQNNGGNPAFTGNPFLTPALTTNTTWYVCKYNTGSSCESSRTAVTVAVNSLPAFTTTYTDITCFGAGDGKITINVDNASGSYQYSINNGSAYTYSGNSPKSITGLITGEYKIRVIDANGCESPLCP